MGKSFDFGNFVFFSSVCAPNRLTYLHIHFIIIGFEPLLSPNAGFHFLHHLLRLNVATDEIADERRTFCHFDYIFFSSFHLICFYDWCK